LPEDAAEVLIPKCQFGTDFIAVVYRYKVVDVLLLADRTSALAHLASELVYVQEYVDNLQLGYKKRATDIEVKHGNNAYVVRVTEGVPHIMIPALDGGDFAAGDHYLSANERGVILALASSSAPSSSEKPSLTEIAPGRRRGTDRRGSTSGTISNAKIGVELQRQAAPGIEGRGGVRAQNAGLRHKLDQFGSAAKRIIKAALGGKEQSKTPGPTTATISNKKIRALETQKDGNPCDTGAQPQAIAGREGSGGVSAASAGVLVKHDVCARASEAPPSNAESKAASKAGENDGEQLTAPIPARKAVGEQPILGRILVVDDEDTIREILISTLAAAHFECRGAASGVEALALLESGEFDLVLADLMMKEMDGIALLERVRDLYLYTPVVIVTAVHDISVALQTLRNGAYDYLLKPFEPEQLLATVGRALENRRLKCENDAYRANLEGVAAGRTQQWKTALSNLERAYDIILEGFGDALALRDAETEAHSRRVTAYVIAMARKMGLPQEEISVIARAALLHDIGKLAISDSILCKPGVLTPDETVMMRQYVYRGFVTIQRVPFLVEAARIIYCHQERHDGSGYPRGLRGEEIPLGARLIAVANTLDAITSDRPYRAAQSFDAARAEIECWSGHQFDPEIVKTFLSVPPNLWKDLRNDINGEVQCNESVVPLELSEVQSDSPVNYQPV
jgi:response regulator RpfG family c-di-GMP phosphodiesterase